MNKKIVGLVLVLLGAICTITLVFRVVQENNRFSFEEKVEERAEEHQDIKEVSDKEEVASKKTSENELKLSELFKLTGDAQYSKEKIGSIHKLLSVLIGLICSLLFTIVVIRTVFSYVFMCFPFMKDVFGKEDKDFEEYK